MADQLKVDDLALNLHKFEVSAIGLESATHLFKLRLDLLFHLAPSF